MAFYEPVTPTFSNLGRGIFQLGKVTFAGGTTDPTVSDALSSATHAATGRYNVVLKGTGSLAVTAFFLQTEADEELNAVVRSYTAATRTLVVDVYDSAGAANVDSGDGLYVFAAFPKP